MWFVISSAIQYRGKTTDFQNPLVGEFLKIIFKSISDYGKGYLILYYG